LDSGGLQPVAQLPKLRELVLDGHSLRSAQPLVQLLSSSVQGCLLKIKLLPDVPQTIADHAISARDTESGAWQHGRAPAGACMCSAYVQRSDAEEYIRAFHTFTLH
jgi:hypothetical protein